MQRMTEIAAVVETDSLIYMLHLSLYFSFQGKYYMTTFSANTAWFLRANLTCAQGVRMVQRHISMHEKNYKLNISGLKGFKTKHNQ